MDLGGHPDMGPHPPERQRSAMYRLPDYGILWGEGWDINARNDQTCQDRSRRGPPAFPYVTAGKSRRRRG